MLPVKKKYCFAKELRVCAPVLEVPTTVVPNPEVKSFGHRAIWSSCKRVWALRFKVLGWVGLGVTTGRGSKTRSKIFSLASNHQFTHFDFTSGGVIPGKIPLHSHVCTGEFTQTGVTLAVFFYQEYPGWSTLDYNIQFDTVFTLIHKNLGKVPKNPKKNLVQYLL